jgi:transposase
VNRRARRTKTDRLDLTGLLNLLARYLWGDRRVWRVLRVPTLAQEDARHWHRTRETLQQDQTRVINRLKSLMATLGVAVPVAGDFLGIVENAQLWDGTAVPAGAYQRLRHEWTLLQEVERQLEELDATREARPLAPTTATCVTKLQTLRGIGPLGADVLATEIFGWRQIRNGRELGALVGLVPGRYQSGETDRELGITRAGNTHVRRITVQLAWSWLRNQRASALVEWYQRRFGGGSKRLRRIGIVALARKLLIALWRYVDQGILPDGTVLKPLAG